MIRAVLFDIDGVLLDSLKANTEHYQRAFSHFGYAPPAEKDLAEVHHMPAKRFIRYYLPTISDEQVERVFEYLQSLPQRQELFEVPKDATETVRSLSTKYRLAAVSARTHAAMEGVLTFLDIRSFFEVLVGFEDTTVHKPDPEPLLVAARRLKVNPDECVYVGDMQADIDAARAAGMKMIHYSTEVVSGSHKTVSRFQDIVTIIRALG
ncbi:MAG: HAD family hydrolase [Candidatus Kerfeldbacteria bacterium]